MITSGMSPSQSASGSHAWHEMMSANGPWKSMQRTHLVQLEDQCFCLPATLATHVEDEGVDPPYCISNTCSIILLATIVFVVLIVLIPSAINGSLIGQLHGHRIMQHSLNLYVCHHHAF
jgi:hypothetical protein